MAEVERVDYDNTVAAFTALMLKKLRENDHKTHWLNETVKDLFGFLVSEVKELSGELEREEGFSAVKVARECADVANLALMVADVVGGLDMELPAREAVTIDALQRRVVELEKKVEDENKRWKAAYSEHFTERTKRQNLEYLFRVMAEGFGNLQAGHHAPWDTACEDEERDEWVIEDAHGNHVMSADEDEWLNDGDTPERFTRDICHSVNLSDEIVSRLFQRGELRLDYEEIQKAVWMVERDRKVRSGKPPELRGTVAEDGPDEGPGASGGESQEEAKEAVEEGGQEGS